MKLEVFTCGPVATNTFLVICSQTGKACVIDAPQGSATLIWGRGIAIESLFLTHSHWDHIADAGLFHPQALIWVHSLDAENLRKPGSDGLPCPIDIVPTEPDRELTDGMELHVGKLRFTVIHTPGHSPGCVCLYEEKQGVLFSGDTLFHTTYGRTNFPTSSPTQMKHSLRRLAELPPETKFYPGHGPASTLAKEKWLYQSL